MCLNPSSRTSLMVLLLGASLGVAACSSDSAGDGSGTGRDGGVLNSPFPDANASLADGGPGTGHGADDPGCRHIDVVLSVDDSSSMQEEMSALSNDVFPAFARRLLEISDARVDDFRVAVQDACPTPATYHTRGEGGDCGFASGKPWMVSGEANLEDKFRCVGAIDSSDYACTGNNDDEQPASAAAASFEDPARTGGNAGFLRSNALLVVVSITDEDEQPTPDADAASVAARLAAAKGGDMSKMVFLGIAGGRSCEGTYGHADDAVKMKAIAGEFAARGRGVFWDLCDGRLEDGLGAALQVIENACDDFEPID